jgi:large subunit ribosomal protein L11
MILKLLVEGGDMKPGPAVGQKLGPLGINIGQVVQEVNKATQEFKGLKVPVEVDISKDKSFDIKVLSPPTSELLKKELNIEKASGEAKKIKVANASIEQIISVAKTKHPNMLDKDFKSAVKSVVGCCVSAGILVENQSPKDIEKEIDDGKYDKEIKEVRTQTPPEKKKILDDYFTKLTAKQEEKLKQEEEEKAAKEAEKAEAKEGEEKEGKVEKEQGKKPEEKQETEKEATKKE